jgi:hypothetical protein
LGARFDAWDEWSNWDAWDKAFSEFAKLNHGSYQDLLTHYLHRRRDVEETLPWDHLNSGVDKRFLVQEYENSQKPSLLRDCRDGCHACGILRNYREFQSETWQCPVLQ